MINMNDKAGCHKHNTKNQLNRFKAFKWNDQRIGYKTICYHRSNKAVKTKTIHHDIYGGPTRCFSNHIGIDKGSIEIVTSKKNNTDDCFPGVDVFPKRDSDNNDR